MQDDLKKKGVKELRRERYKNIPNKKEIESDKKDREREREREKEKER